MSEILVLSINALSGYSLLEAWMEMEMVELLTVLTHELQIPGLPGILALMSEVPSNRAAVPQSFQSTGLCCCCVLCLMTKFYTTGSDVDLWHL